MRLKGFLTTSDTYYLLYGLPASLAGPIYLAAKSSRLIPQKKDRDEFRFVAFGGSTTARWGELQKRNWPGWLEKLLQDAFPNRKVIAENWGQNGARSNYVATSVRHRLSFIKGQKDLLDLIIIYSGVNDAYFVGSFMSDSHWSERLYQWIGSRSLFFVSMRYKVSRLSRLFTAAKLARNGNRPRRERPSDAKILLTLELVSDRYRTNISDAVTFAKAMNVPVIVGTIPIDGRRAPQPLVLAHETIFRILREVANDHRVPLVDVSRKFQATPNRYKSFSADSVHVNEQGMKWVAAVFFKGIIKVLAPNG